MLQNLTIDEKFHSSPFSSYNYEMTTNDPGYHHILSPQCIHTGCIALKWKYSEYRSSYTILQYEIYRDPGKGKAIEDSIINTTPIAFIFSR